MATPIRTRRWAMSSWHRSLLLAFGLTVLAGPALAQTAPPANLRERFQKMDKNGDGRLDHEEFHRGVVEVFYFRDKNRKGYLVIEELGSSPEAFKAANAKADGRLSLEEYVNALFKDFETADTNRDGVLVYEELEVYVRTNRR